MTDKLYLYPIWIRVWHGLNAVLCLILILTGLSLQYSNPDYSFFIRFDLAVSIHNYSGIVLSISYILFFLGNLFQPNGRHYRIKIEGFINRVFIQFKFYAFGIFKGQNPPFPITENSKFNPLQKLTYVILMYFLVPVVIISGLILLYPDSQLSNLFGPESVHLFDLFHLVTGFIICLFMIIHVYFCTIGKSPLSNFKSIVNGWHESH